MIVSKVALEYKDCLIGNAYEQRLGLKNVGDVNYPLTITLDKEHADLSFSPATLVLAPFNDGSLNILYTPTRQTKTSVVLIISSPYSVNKIPITLHSGTANLEFSPMDTLEFGMFEKMTKPQMTLKIKNAGTCPTSFTVKDITKPSKFTVTNNKGVLTPGKTVEVIVTFVRHEIGTFKEILAVRTDLINKIYEIFATGRCEEAVVHPAEINFLKLGVCPILEPTTVPLQIRNYGYFPLSYSIKSAYPLKVSPTSGSIDGETTGQLFVSWTPSGSYELRTQMVISSNIGNLNVTVHGKSCFPELAVKSSTIDFGVCAVGHIYKEMGTIQNKGRVPLFYSISPPKETCFIVGRSSGTLLPKQEHDFSVAFSPTGQGRFTTGVVIECKGINYKEIIVSGVGAILKVDISPRNIDLGILN